MKFLSFWYLTTFLDLRHKEVGKNWHAIKSYFSFLRLTTELHPYSLFQLQPPMFRLSSLIFKCHCNLLSGLSASNWFSLQFILRPCTFYIHFFHFSLSNSGLHHDVVLSTPLALSQSIPFPLLVEPCTLHSHTKTLHPKEASVLTCLRAYPNPSRLRFPACHKIFPYRPPLHSLPPSSHLYATPNCYMPTYILLHRMASDFSLSNTIDIVRQNYFEPRGLYWAKSSSQI